MKKVLLPITLLSLNLLQASDMFYSRSASPIDSIQNKKHFLFIKRKKLNEITFLKKKLEKEIEELESEVDELEYNDEYISNNSSRSQSRYGSPNNTGGYYIDTFHDGTPPDLE